MDLSKEIASLLSEYTDEVEEELEQAKKDVAKHGVQTVKQLSRTKTREYQKGWGSKKVGSAIVIYNRNKPSLTHLLEKGHVNRDGSRTQAYPHISVAEEQVIKEFEQRVERAIRK